MRGTSPSTRTTLSSGQLIWWVGFPTRLRYSNASRLIRQSTTVLPLMMSCLAAPEGVAGGLG